MTGEEFDPIEYVSESWWTVILVVVLFAAAAAGGSMFLPPSYRSSTTLLFNTTDRVGGLTGTATGVTSEDSNRAVNTQPSIILGDAVINPTAERAGLSARELRDLVAVSTEQDSNIIEITVRSNSARTAQQLTSTVAETYAEFDRQQGVTALERQADALEDSIASLSSRLEALPTGRTDSVTRARRTALTDEIESLARQQEQLRAAAESYSGQITILSAAELPRPGGVPELIRTAAVGGAVGLVVGVLWAVLRGRQRARRRARLRRQTIASTSGRRANAPAA